MLPLQRAFPEWQSAKFDTDLLQALLDKTTDQILSVGLDTLLLQSMSAEVGVKSLDGNCAPSIESGFRALKSGIKFNLYLTVDTTVDVSAGRSKISMQGQARRIYDLLAVQCAADGSDTEKHSSLVEAESELGSTTLEIANQDPYSTIETPDLGLDDVKRELSVNDLSDAKPRFCEQCQLRRTIIPSTTHAIAYFNTLTAHAINLRAIQRKQVNRMEETMQYLARSLSEVTTPSKLSGQKSDLDMWRTIIQHFLDAKILNTHCAVENEFTDQSVQIKRLLKLQTQVMDIERVSLSSFLRRSTTPRADNGAEVDVERLLQSQRFRCSQSNIILKKLLSTFRSCHEVQNFLHDQRLAILQAVRRFKSRTCVELDPSFVHFLKMDDALDDLRPFPNATGSLFVLEVVRVIPQLEDDSCPICSDLAFKPIRLNCSHILCIRCAINLQRRLRPQCPLCRQETVMTADSYNLDHERMRFLETFFPTEAKRKQQENEKKVANERFRQRVE